MPRLPRLAASATLALLAAVTPVDPTGSLTAQAHAQDPRTCVLPGGWLGVAGSGFAVRSAADLIAEASRRPVVLLGEQHDRADHHRWQLQVLAALHARRPDMVIGFEMFPRRVQPVLDRWIAGELSEADFLRLSDWNRVWGFDARLYLPLFHFARMNRIPMLALNVERTLVRDVGSGGWDSVPEARREGVGRAAAASSAYQKRLRETFAQHLPPRDPSRPQDGASEARVLRFIEAQLTWDRAMAEAIARRARTPSAPLVVGVIGSGHLQFGQGVPEQLRALGIADGFTMIPFDADASAGASVQCAQPDPALADAVFMVPAGIGDNTAPRPRLGVTLANTDGLLRIDRVSVDSLAERSGLRDGDQVLRVAGLAVKTIEDLTAAVRDQPPGTVLPIVVQRKGREIEVMIRFAPRAP